MDRRQTIRRLSLTLLVGICSALTVALAAFTLSRTSSFAPASYYTRARVEEAARILMANRAAETSAVAEAATESPAEPALNLAAMPEMPAPVPEATAEADEEEETEPWAYRGGVGSGVKSVRTLNTETQVLPRSRGGFGDGNAMAEKKPVLKPQYLGGLSDGWHSAQSPLLRTEHYLGGISDGFISGQTPFIYTEHYLGGISDGFSSDQTPFLYTAHYKGGMSEGLISQTQPCHNTHS